MAVDIIAEIGVNHDGSVSRAKNLISEALLAGATTVKFQMFRTDEIVSKDAELAEYQKENLVDSDSQSKMLRELELSPDQLRELMQYSNDLGVEFLCTAFDAESLHWLLDHGQKRIKIASGELTNFFLLEEIAKLTHPVLVSTGMATVDDIEAALRVLLSSGKASSDITLLQCTSSYPTSLRDASVMALPFLKERFSMDVGFSDHTTSFHSAIAAVSLGAKVIEKHVTYDRNAAGPDHRASADFLEFTDYVTHIRMVETALGQSDKVPTASELSTARSARRSLVASLSVKEGDIFTRDNVRARRPGNGLNPMQFPDLEGTAATRDYQAGELISFD